MPPRLLAEPRWRIILLGWGNLCGLAYDGLCPEWDVVSVALEDLTGGHAEKQTGLGVLYGVVVDVEAVGNGCNTLAVEDGLLIAGASHS